MVNHKATTFLALALLAQPLQIRTDPFNDMGSLKIAGIVAAAVGMGALAVKYFTPKSDKELIYQGLEAQEAYKSYEHLMMQLAESEFIVSEQMASKLISEQHIIPECAQNTKRALQANLNKVSAALKALKAREDKIENPETSRIPALVVELTAQEQALQKACICMEAYAKYCLLTLFVSDISTEFKEILRLVEKCDGDNVKLARAITDFASPEFSSSFLFYSRSENIRIFLSQLITAIKECAQEFPILAQKAQDIHDKLAQAYAVMILDSRYVLERERERRNREWHSQRHNYAWPSNSQQTAHPAAAKQENKKSSECHPKEDQLALDEMRTALSSAGFIE